MQNVSHILKHTSSFVLNSTRSQYGGILVFQHKKTVEKGSFRKSKCVAEDEYISNPELMTFSWQNTKTIILVIVAILSSPSSLQAVNKIGNQQQLSCGNK